MAFIILSKTVDAIKFQFKRLFIVTSHFNFTYYGAQGAGRMSDTLTIDYQCKTWWLGSKKLETTLNKKNQGLGVHKIILFWSFWTQVVAYFWQKYEALNPFQMCCCRIICFHQILSTSTPISNFIIKILNIYIMLSCTHF